MISTWTPAIGVANGRTGYKTVVPYRRTRHSGAVWTVRRDGPHTTSSTTAGPGSPRGSDDRDVGRGAVTDQPIQRREVDVSLDEVGE